MVRTRSVPSGDTTSRTPRASSSSSIATIATVSLRPAKNSSACSTRTSSATPSSSSLPTSRIFPYAPSPVSPRAPKNFPLTSAPLERHERCRDYRQARPSQPETSRLGTSFPLALHPPFPSHGLVLPSSLPPTNHHLSNSTSSPPAPPLEMVCTRVSSGSPLPSARPVISRRTIEKLSNQPPPSPSCYLVSYPLASLLPRKNPRIRL